MRTLTCLLMLLLACPLLADVGPKPRKTAPGPLPQRDLEGVNVEMTSEDVKLVLSKGKDGDILDVEATFHMTNLGEATTFEIGFPCGPYTNMKRFSVHTDGVKNDFELIDRAAKEGKADKQEGTREFSRHDYWYVWEASYGAKAKVTHVVRYQLEIFHFSEYRDTGYVLNTGAGWKNKIGKAVVTLSFAGDLSAEHVRDVGPAKGLEFKDGVYTWTFIDLEPTTADNINISYNNRFTFGERLKQYRAEAGKFWSSKLELVYLTRGAHKRFGRDKMTETELADYVAALSGLLEEMKEEGNKVTMPATSPTRIDWGDTDLPEGLRKQMESEMGEETRNYAYKGEAHSLLNLYKSVLEAAGNNASRADVKTMLERWNKLMAAFFDGNLFAGANKMTIGGKLHDKLSAEYTKQLAEGRKLAE
ncbi:MAG: hypothetical protein KF754_02935 [Planctomycetes bacterium]|nr:hypothetical protein [Planctomycetota bacterium]